MLRTLRSRLILSHILPLVIIVPLMYVALSYLLETRFLIPKLAQDLLNDAGLLTDFSRKAYLATGDMQNTRFALQQLELNPQVRLVLLESDGSVVFSNDADYQFTDERIQLPGWEQVQAGEEKILTSYSFLPGRPYSVQTLSPVFGDGQEVIGVLWLSMRICWLGRSSARCWRSPSAARCARPPRPSMGWPAAITASRW